MDDFNEIGFADLNFESALESILGHVDRTKSDPPLSQVQSVDGTEGSATPSPSYSHAIPQTSTQESSVSCPSCEQYKTDLERLDREHRVNFQFLKKKIINTDLLIRRCKAMQDESDLQKKTIESLEQKLDQAKRDSSILSDQLKTTVESIKPLQERGTELESALRRKSLEIDDLHTSLAAEKAFGNQRAALDEHSKHLQDTVNLMKKEVSSLKTRKQKWETKANDLAGGLEALKGENQTCKSKIHILAKALYQAQAVINKQWEILLANGLKVGKGPNVIPAKYNSLVRAAMGGQNLESFNPVTANCDNESDDPDFFQDVSDGSGNEDRSDLDKVDDGEDLEEDSDKVKTSQKKGVKTRSSKPNVERSDDKSETAFQKKGENAEAIPEAKSPSFSSISDFDFSDDNSGEGEKKEGLKRSSFASTSDIKSKSDEQIQAKESIGKEQVLDPSGSSEGVEDSNSEWSSAVAKDQSNIKGLVSTMNKIKLSSQKNREAKNELSEHPVCLPKTAEGRQDTAGTHSVKAEVFGISDLELSDDEDDDVKAGEKVSSMTESVDSKRKRLKKKMSPAMKSASSGSSGISDLELSDDLAEPSSLDKMAIHSKANWGISERLKWNESKSFKKDTKKANLSKLKTSPRKKEPKMLSSFDISDDDLELPGKKEKRKDGSDTLLGRNKARAGQSNTWSTPNLGKSLNPYKNKTINNFLASNDRDIPHLSDSEEEEESNDLEMPFKKFISETKDFTEQADVEVYKKEDLSSLLAFSMIDNVLSPLAPSPCPSAMSDTQIDDENILMPIPLSDSSDFESEAGAEAPSDQSVLRPNVAEGEKTVSCSKGASDKELNEDIVMEETVSFNTCEKDDAVCDKSSNQNDTLSTSNLTEGSSHTSTGSFSVGSTDGCSSGSQEQSGKSATESTAKTPGVTQVHDKTVELTKVSVNTRELSHSFDENSEVAQIFNETSELIHVPDKAEELTPVSNRTGESDIVSDTTSKEVLDSGKTEDLTLVADKRTGILTHVSDETSESAQVSEKTEELMSASEMTSELAPASDEGEELVCVSEKTGKLTTVCDDTQELVQVFDKIPEVNHGFDDTPDLCTASDKIPELPCSSEANSEPPQVLGKTPEFIQVTNSTPQVTQVPNKTLEKTQVLGKEPKLTPEVSSQTKEQDGKESLPSSLKEIPSRISVSQREMSKMVSFTSEKEDTGSKALSSQNEETLDMKEKTVSKLSLPPLKDDCKSENHHGAIASKSIPSHESNQKPKAKVVSVYKKVSLYQHPRKQGFKSQIFKMTNKTPSPLMGDKKQELQVSNSSAENKTFSTFEFGSINSSGIEEKVSTPRIVEMVEMSPDISEKSVIETSSRRPGHTCEPFVHGSNAAPQVPLSNDSTLESNVNTTAHFHQHEEKQKSNKEDSKPPAEIFTPNVKGNQPSRGSVPNTDVKRQPSLPEFRKTDDSNPKFTKKSHTNLPLPEHQEVITRLKIVSNTASIDVLVSSQNQSEQLPTSVSQATTTKSADTIEREGPKPRLVFDGSLSIEELAVSWRALVDSRALEDNYALKSNNETSEIGTESHVHALGSKPLATNREIPLTFSTKEDGQIHESSGKNSDQFNFDSENTKVSSSVKNIKVSSIVKEASVEDLGSRVMTRQTKEHDIIKESDDVEEPGELVISDAFDDVPLQIDETSSSEIPSPQKLKKSALSTNDAEAVTHLSPSPDTDKINQKSTDGVSLNCDTTVLNSSYTEEVMEVDKGQGIAQSSQATLIEQTAKKIIQSEGNFGLSENRKPGDVRTPREKIAEPEDSLSEGEIPDSCKESRDALTIGDISVRCVYADGRNFLEILLEMEEFYRVPVLLPPLSPSLLDSGDVAPARTTKTLRRSSRKRASPDKDLVLSSGAVKKRLSKPVHNDSQRGKGKVDAKGDGTAAVRAKLRRKSTEKEESAAVKKVKLIPFTGFGSVLEAVKCDLRHYLAGDSPSAGETKREMCKRGKDGLALAVWPDVIMAVVLQLKSCEEDVLNQMLTAGEGNRPPTKEFISRLESSLFQLLLGFIQQEKDIAVKDLMESLWNAIFDRASLQQHARLSLCRMFTRLCKEQNDEGQLKNLLFNIAWCGYLDFPRCFLSAIGVWPFLATYRPADAAPSHICLVFEFILKRLKEKEPIFFSQICVILETCCRWKMSKANISAEKLLKFLFSKLQGDGKEFSPEGFETMKGIELLLFHMGSAWTQEHFLQRLCVSIVSTWCHGKEKVTPGCLTALFKIIGAVLAGNSTISQPTVKILLGQVFGKAIEKKSRIQELEMAIGESLMALPRFMVDRNLKLLASWEEHNKDIIPNQVLVRVIQFRCAYQSPKTKKKKNKNKNKNKNKKGL